MTPLKLGRSQPAGDWRAPLQNTSCKGGPSEPGRAGALQAPLQSAEDATPARGSPPPTGRKAPGVPPACASLGRARGSLENGLRVSKDGTQARTDYRQAAGPVVFEKRP